MIDSNSAKLLNKTTSTGMTNSISNLLLIPQACGQSKNIILQAYYAAGSFDLNEACTSVACSYFVLAHLFVRLPRPGDSERDFSVLVKLPPTTICLITQR